MVRETYLAPHHLVLPLFVQAGQNLESPISSMPGQARLSIDRLIDKAREAARLGVRGVALFPALEDALKDPRGRESQNPDGLLQRTVRELKRQVPELWVITDVALDPYSSDGHDGVLIDGRIDNDTTLPLLAAMAVAQARAGADMVAPSDMMDGRVAAIRDALDEAGFDQVGILSYCVKYASAFYGPFREALDSAPRGCCSVRSGRDAGRHQTSLVPLPSGRALPLPRRGSSLDGNAAASSLFRWNSRGARPAAASGHRTIVHPLQLPQAAGRGQRRAAGEAATGDGAVGAAGITPIGFRDVGLV